MADQSKNRMNLAAIKRVDPYAKDIVDSTAHVAFYTFNSDENEWEKTDVEGAFFIYSRNAEPFNSIFINNRLNTTSFVEPITGQLEIQSQAPFLLYRNERSRIRGFWFYNSSECDRIGDLVCSLIQDCVVKQKTSGTAANQSVNIFNMLSKAQQDFQSGLNTGGGGGGGGGGGNNQQDLGSRNVMNFFAAAKPTPSSELPLFRRLLSNTLSVEQLEKQQVKAPLNETLQQLPKIEPELMSKINLLKKPEQPKCDLEMSPLAKFLNIQNIMKPSSASLNKDSELPKNAVVRHPVEQPSAPKPALMPPTMFEKSIKVDKIAQDSSVTCNPVKPLTQSQLVKTICYLIKNDSEFVRKIHEAYVKQFSEISNDFLDD
ncbi:mRNA-decapping enzyme 1A [Episyrphus balteatus]|uniref:mRNA-decapping enzyme 1A n=1 Tax=Episyrphus balteatus TaxID=286459 RepID=UPI002484FE16|nr:mRNA-decapping enzyme 1A [Episyrphus balteatus]